MEEDNIGSIDDLVPAMNNLQVEDGGEPWVAESTHLHASWVSSTYPKIMGKCEIIVPPEAAENSHFDITCVLTYSLASTFRAGVTRTFNLHAVKGPMRIVAQTELSLEQQLMITITFEKLLVGAFYASVFPIDCGTFKPDESKDQWKTAFGL